jgi:hypothetical protein
MKSKVFLTSGVLACCIFFLSAFTGWFDGPADPAMIRKTVTRSLSALEQSGNIFITGNSVKCASCHHTSLTSMTAAVARKKGLQVVDSSAALRVIAMRETLKFAGNPNQIDRFLFGVNFLPAYVLLGLDAEKFAPDFNTDVAVDLLMTQQMPSGEFFAEVFRAPLESGRIHLAALSIHAIQLYASPAKHDRVERMVAATRRWLEEQNPANQQELVFQLLGTHWCNSGAEQEMKLARKLEAMQQKDGGWAQLATMKTDAYATGQALCALFETGAVKPEDAIYQRGLKFLLKTVDAEGAWEMPTRSYAIQPHFSTDFPPYDKNQFISATATNWATMALLYALPDQAASATISSQRSHAPIPSYTAR